MKKLIFTLLLSVTTIANAQVIIGDETGTATVKTSVLLEFANTQNKGIILPYVRTLPAAATSNRGSILLDGSTATAARVKFSNGTTWTDLSGQDGNITSALSNQPTGITEGTAKTIIGAQTSTAEGVLVLESTTKAMVLPMVNSTDDIINPAPGMMVYLNKSGAKRLAVFNGSRWSYWK